MSDFVKKLVVQDGLIQSGVSGQVTSSDGTITIIDSTNTIDLSAPVGKAFGVYGGATLTSNFALSASVKTVTGLDVTLPAGAATYLFIVQLWLDVTLTSGTGNISAFLYDTSQSQNVPGGSMQWETTVAGTYMETITVTSMPYTVTGGNAIEVRAVIGAGGVFASADIDGQIATAQPGQTHLIYLRLA